MVLFLFLPLNCSWAQITISKHAQQYFISRPLSLIIFNYQKSRLLLFFFLKRARPDSVDRAIGLGHFEFKLQRTLPYWGVTTKTKTSFLESGQFYERPQARILPGATKAKLAALLHANHWQREMTLNDPKVQLAAELALWCRKLQEQFPGVPALAMNRKRAQSGRRLWPHRLLDGS